MAEAGWLNTPTTVITTTFRGVNFLSRSIIGRLLTVPRGSIALRIGFLPTDIRTALRVAVPAHTFETIDVGRDVKPDDGISRAMLLRFSLELKTLGRRGAKIGSEWNWACEDREYDQYGTKRPLHLSPDVVPLRKRSRAGPNMT
jgi:hypothetical protein